MAIKREITLQEKDSVKITNFEVVNKGWKLKFPKILSTMARVRPPHKAFIGREQKVICEVYNQEKDLE